MDFVFLFEIFAEIFGNLYLNFALSLVLDKKLKKWQMHLLNAITIFVSVLILLSICFGAVFLATAENQTTHYCGLGLTIAGGVFLLIQIILYAITKKREKELKKKKAMEHRYRKLQEQNANNTNEIIIEQNENQSDNKQG